MRPIRSASRSCRQENLRHCCFCSSSINLLGDRPLCRAKGRHPRPMTKYQMHKCKRHGQNLCRISKKIGADPPLTSCLKIKRACSASWSPKLRNLRHRDHNRAKPAQSASSVLLFRRGKHRDPSRGMHPQKYPCDGTEHGVNHPCGRILALRGRIWGQPPDIHPSARAIASTSAISAAMSKSAIFLAAIISSERLAQAYMSARRPSRSAAL